MIGWVKIHREIQNSWLWEEKPFSRGQAFVDLIMMANHEDRKVIINGTLINVKRGSRITSIRKLADKWGWSTSKVNYFLKQLESDNMITVKKDNKKTLLAIENYDLYQGRESIKKHKSDTEITQKNFKSKTEVTQKNTNKNDKEYIKNDKEGKEIKEETGHNASPSFPSPLYKKIFDNLGDVSYRTWFSDTSMTESDNLVTINVSDSFKKKVIREKFLQCVEVLAGKEVVVN